MTGDKEKDQQETELEAEIQISELVVRKTWKERIMQKREAEKDQARYSNVICW